MFNIKIHRVTHNHFILLEVDIDDLILGCLHRTLSSLRKRKMGSLYISVGSHGLPQ